MPTRRQTLFTLGNLFVLGGAAQSGASAVVGSSSNASFRVVDDTTGDNSIELTPANDPPIYVQTDDDGDVSGIDLDDDSAGLSKRAITRFEDIVEITNTSTDPLQGIYFSFEATSSVLSAETLDDVENTLQATAGANTLDSSGPSGDNLLAVSSETSVSDGVLGPSESVAFGLQVNLVSSSEPGSFDDLPPSEDYELTLRVHTEWPDA
ncbi:hypothetical protein [Haloferax sp. DFSO52]|uniref:hypothetical protein n=1 Tax=Haloferax sp. DFSO52 TaxID=3388505 RepID=UPI003A85779B